MSDELEADRAILRSVFGDVRKVLSASPSVQAALKKRKQVWPSADHKAIGRRLRAMRQALMLSQDTFAERLGVTRSHISDAETGRVRVTADLLVCLMREMPFVDIGWLLIGWQRGGGDAPK